MHRLLGSTGFAARWIGLVVSITAALASCSNDEPVTPETLSTVDAMLLDPVALERGRALYEGSCASFCHEVEDPDLAVNLFDCQWRHASEDADIFDIITRGIPDTRMVGFGENFPEGEQDTWRLVAYIRSRQAQCTQEAE